MIGSQAAQIQRGSFAQAFPPSLHARRSHFAGPWGWGWGVNTGAVIPSRVSLP